MASVSNKTANAVAKTSKGLDDMTVTNTIGGLEVAPSKKCEVCTIQQQLRCRANVSIQLAGISLELGFRGFEPEQIGNGKSFEVGCHIYDPKSMTN